MTPSTQRPERIAKAVAISPVPGLALALVEDGGLGWADGFGVRNADRSDRVDWANRKPPPRIASCIDAKH